MGTSIDRYLQEQLNKPRSSIDTTLQKAEDSVDPFTGRYRDPQPDPFGEGDSTLPSLIGKVAKFPWELAKGMVESVNIAPELFGGEGISRRQRMGRLFNLATLPLPLAAPFKIAKTASIAKKVAGAAAGSALIGGASAAIEGADVIPRATGAGLVGAGLETGLSALLRRKVRLRGAASKARFEDDAKFADPTENPFIGTKDWAITSPMLTKAERKLSPEANQARLADAENEFNAMGQDATRIHGYRARVKNPDAAYIMHGVDLPEAIETAQRWKQDWAITPQGFVDLRANTIRPITAVRFDGAVLPKDNFIEVLVGGKQRRVAFDYGAPQSINPKAIGKQSKYVRYEPDEQQFGLTEPDIHSKLRLKIAQGIRSVYGAEFAERFLKAKETGTFPLPSEVARQDFTGNAEVATSYDGVYSILDRNFKHYDKSLKQIITNNIKGNELEHFDDYLVALRKREIDEQIVKQADIREQEMLAKVQVKAQKYQQQLAKAKGPKSRANARAAIRSLIAERNAIKADRIQWEGSRRLDPADRARLDTDIADMDTNFNHFGRTADEVHGWREAQLEWLYEADVLSRGEVDYIKANAGRYVPLQEAKNPSIDSVLESINEASLTGRSFPVGPNQQLDLQKAKLNLNKVDSPLSRLVTETGDLARAVKRGQVGSTLVRWLDSVGPEVASMFAKRVKTSQVNDFANIKEVIENLKTPMGASDKNLNISGVLTDGTRAHYEITDPAIAEMFYAMNPAELGMYTKLFAPIAAWLRSGATLAFEFLAKNPIRDVLFGKVTSGEGLTTGKGLSAMTDFASSIASAFTKDETFQQALRAGAFKSELIAEDVKVGKNIVQQWVGATEGKDKLINIVKTPYDALQALSLAMERSTRIGAYKAAFEKASKTMNPEAAIRYAALAARDVSTDFGMYGSKTAPIRLTTAFWNAQIQGYWRMQEAFRKDPAGFTKRAIGMITIPSVLFYLQNRNDPEYFNLPSWERTLFWHTKIGDQWIRFPKPFELGVFYGSSVERVMEMLDKHDPAQLDAFAMDYAKKVGFDMIPIPTAARPFIENWKNENFLRGRPVVSKSLEDVEKRFQVQPGTSELAKAMGHYFKVSPVQADNVISGYTAGLGKTVGEFLSGGADVAEAVFDSNKKLSDTKPTFDVKDTWGLRAFASQFPRNAEPIDKLYDFADKARKASATADYLERGLRLDDLTEFAEKKAVMIGIGPQLQPALQALAALRAERGRIMMNDALSPTTKRNQFDALDRQMYDIANTIYAAIKQFDPDAQ